MLPLMNRPVRKLCWLFIFALISVCSPAVRAQELKGKVYEAVSNTDTVALTGAVLHWLNSSVAAVTDADGNFSIKKTSKTNSLVLSYTGYENDTITIDTSRTHVRIFLSKIKSLEEVQIVYYTGTSEFSFMNVSNIQTLNQGELAKAACCNLSESFETNPSVDVNFSDAITGTKQIQMLGLSGQYAMITKENMPYLRGLAGIYGLTFIPGTWINSIQLSKGAGSVINGYESFSGQINTELQKPENSEKLFFNVYGNANGRNEYNLNLTRKLTDVWSTALLSHFSSNPLRQDMNGDGFLDIPTGRQYNFLNRWSYETKKRFEGQFGVNYVNDERSGGQMKFDQKTAPALQAYYGIGIRSEKWDVFAKNGYVFKKPESSTGLQLSFLRHKQSNFYGLNTYGATQETFYANYILQGIIGSTNHKYKTGASFMWDKVSEKYSTFNFSRAEAVPGVFIEYAYSHLKNFNAVAGLRADYHNYYGLFFTPRLHLRYSINDNKTVFRASAGRALKTANIFAENSSLMATSREFIITVSDLDLPYGLKPEVAWNYGLNFLHKFKLNYRDAQFALDFYRIDFVNQVVVDIDKDPQQVLFYNLTGRSFSNTAQAEFTWEIRKRLSTRLAYRFIDTKTQYTSELLPKYLLGQHRAFLNLSYETKNQHWQFDQTTQWNGKKRLPLTASNPTEYQRQNYSPDFFILHAQVTYKTGVKRKFDFYLGVENALNTKQQNPIVSSDSPFGKYFDASMIWGPVYGRMIYGGMRFKIK
jgi:outer membrane receptor for ferrienterochelin and colicins